MKWVKRVGLVLVAALVIFVFGWAPYWLAGLAPPGGLPLDAPAFRAGPAVVWTASQER